MDPMLERVCTWNPDGLFRGSFNIQCRRVIGPTTTMEQLLVVKTIAKNSTLP